jgi:hypothetical protein
MSFLKITDPKKRELIVEEFLRIKHNIQQNSMSEKLGDYDMQRELTKLYRPITDSQETQSAATRSAITALKDSTSTAFQKLSAIMPSPAFQLPSIQAEEPKESLIKLGPTATEYLRSMASKTLTDKTFGLHDKNGTFYIGDSEVKITGDDIIVGESKFDGTPGLWELITSKSPDSKIYTTNDLDSYETILLNTNAIVNPETGKVKSSSSDKYRNIIKPIYDQHLRPKKTQNTGKGISGISLMPSDPNALVEMLGLRWASYKAGNTGVRNEIIDISDVLLRQGVLNNDVYKNLMLQLKNVDTN